MKIQLKDKYRLQELLLRKGFSKRELGRKAHISEVYSQQICNGDRNPSAKVAKRICEALEVTFDDIFFITRACNCEQEPINTGTDDK